MGLCGGAGRPLPEGGHPGRDTQLPDGEGQAEEEPAAPALPEAENLHHPRAEHQEDPEAGAAGLQWRIICSFGVLNEPSATDTPYTAMA